MKTLGGLGRQAQRGFCVFGGIHNGCNRCVDVLQKAAHVENLAEV